MTTGTDRDLQCVCVCVCVCACVRVFVCLCVCVLERVYVCTVLGHGLKMVTLQPQPLSSSQHGDHPFAVCDGPTKRPQQMPISGWPPCRSACDIVNVTWQPASSQCMVILAVASQQTYFVSDCTCQNIRLAESAHATSTVATI